MSKDLEIKKVITKRDNGTLRVQHFTQGESLTRQSERDSTDINKIVARAQKTGFLPEGNGQGWYGDVSEIGDYRSALEIVQRANEAFMALPAEIRRDLDNDPAKLVEYLSDAKNLNKAIEHGLIVKQNPSNQPSVSDGTTASVVDGDVKEQ